MVKDAKVMAVGLALTAMAACTTTNHYYPTPADGGGSETQGEVYTCETGAKFYVDECCPRIGNCNTTGNIQKDYQNASDEFCAKAKLNETGWKDFLNNCPPNLCVGNPASEQLEEDLKKCSKSYGLK